MKSVYKSRRNQSIAALAAALLLLLGLAPRALAHAILLGSEPPPNAVLSTSPAQVRLILSEPLVAGISSIRVYDRAGREVQEGQAAPGGPNNTELSVALPRLAEGSYLVTWRAFSAVDGHTTEGTYTFSVGVAGQTAAASAAATQTSPMAAVWRGLLLLAQAAVGGALVFRWWVWLPGLRAAQAVDAPDPVATRGLYFFYGALGLTAVAATGVFLNQILTAADMGLGDLLNGSLPVGTLVGTRLGTAWIGRLAVVIGLAVIASDIYGKPADGEAAGGLWARVVRYAGLWLAGLLLYFTTASSHSAALSVGTWLSWPIAADWLHLAATAAWAGGLLQFPLVAWPAQRGAATRQAALAQVVLRYSTLAAFGVGLMLLSGIYLSALHVGGWERLAGSEYGRMLLIKIALVLPMLLLGGANLLWLKPRLAMSNPAGPSSPAAVSPAGRWFWRIVTMEAIAGVAVLAAAGRLTELPRGADAATLGPGVLRLFERADDLRIGLTLRPARQGPNEFEVVLTPAGEATVSLRFISLDRALGAVEVLLDEVEPGVHTATNGTLNLPGAWQVEAAVRRPDAYDTFARFEVYVQPDGQITAGRGQSGLARMALPFAGLLSGLALVAGATAWLLIARRAAEGRLAYYGLAALAFAAAFAGGTVLLRFFSETTPGSLLTNPAQADALSLVTGQTIYRERCAECHGPGGQGDGPQAAGLRPRPPQPFSTGRAARALDGDLFWWIQNGVAGSAMPAHRAVLSDDQAWHVVNYLKTLGAGALAEAGGPTPVPLPPTPTPPGGPLPEPGQSEDAAITLLDQVELAMERLRYLREEQTITDDLGQSLTFVYEFAAPDRLRYSAAGQEVVVIGNTQYYRREGGEWRTTVGEYAYTFPPTHGYTQNAVGAVYEGEGTLNGRPVQIVAFADSTLPAAYRLWVDAESKRILQLVMEGPNHHMLSRYDQFDVPVEIEAPVDE